jgi:hypothetical protein
VQQQQPQKKIKQLPSTSTFLAFTVIIPGTVLISILYPYWWAGGLYVPGYLYPYCYCIYWYDAQHNSATREEARFRKAEWDNYLRHGPRGQAEYHHGFEHCI